jgi:hypothetical protein
MKARKRNLDDQTVAVMAERFSGVVKLGDLNDFIAPSQACIVNLNGGKIQQPSSDANLKVQFETLPLHVVVGPP